MEEAIALFGVDLAWRVEQACFNAWPALNQVHAGDWVARAGNGLTRRNNSANPLRTGARLDETTIDTCESVYGRWALRPTFRVPSFVAAAVDQRLEARGYAREGETNTLYAPMDALAASNDPEAVIWRTAGYNWMKAKAEFSGLSPDDVTTFRDVAARLSIPTAFIALREGGASASLAYGAVHAGLLCVEAVVTRESLRGRGLGRRMLSSLFAWARGEGAEAACLQVQADNVSGLALYAAVGFRTNLYNYHYRRAPSG